MAASGSGCDSAERIDSIPCERSIAVLIMPSAVIILSSAMSI
jgi:hypothetical protein